jgi:formylglycine-generating enzyme
MRRFRRAVCYLAAAIVALSVAVASADVLHMPSGLTNLELVTVGNPGNAGEWSGGSYGGYGPDRICGAVGYNYQIGKYEITAGQYTEFLNAKAKSDPYRLYSTNMANPDNYVWGCNIQRLGNDGSYAYSVASDWVNRPVNYVSFWDAARFTNWLNNGQGNGDTETGAYTLNSYNGYDGRAIARNAGAQWFLPSLDEWYKAAYHKNDGVTGNYWDYPTKSDTPPGRDMSETTNPGNNANYYVDSNSCPIDSGKYYTTIAGQFGLSDSPYGTFDQGGNVWEWNEAIVEEGVGYAWRGLRGGSFDYWSYYFAASACGRYGCPPDESCDIGFRVASVPEPGSLAMLAGIALTVLLFYWRKRD